MPRKPRITALPVEQQDLTPATEEQGKTDAEQMTDIINEVKEERKAEEPKEAVSDAPVVVKPKAKRASRVCRSRVAAPPPCAVPHSGG